MIRYYAFFNNEKICYDVKWFDDVLEKVPPTPEDGNYVKEIDSQTYEQIVKYGGKYFSLDDNLEIVSSIPYLHFKIIDTNGNTVTSIKRSQDFKLVVDLTDSNGSNIQLNGSYIVPYFSLPDERQKGAIKIDITNGHGETTINIPFSGVFTFKLTRIINLETMSPPYPLPILKDGHNFKFAVYD